MSQDRNFIIYTMITSCTFLQDASENDIIMEQADRYSRMAQSLRQALDVLPDSYFHRMLEIKQMKYVPGYGGKRFREEHVHAELAATHQDLLLQFQKRFDDALGQALRDFPEEASAEEIEQLMGPAAKQKYDYLGKPEELAALSARLAVVSIVRGAAKAHLPVDRIEGPSHISFAARYHERILGRKFF